MIRLAFVGCGAVTEEEHLPALRGLPGAQVVAAGGQAVRLKAAARRLA